MMKTLKNSTYSLYNRLFKDRTEVALFLTAFLVPMIFGLYMVYRWGYVYVNVSDCLAHLYIARCVIDNGVNSGIAQLGTVWLPVFHLLLIPFVAIDFLYTTGLAGTIVNSLMTAGISVLIYRLLDEKKLALLASLLFLFNPYTLFWYGASVWMPSTGIFFMLLSIYYFKHYLEKDDLTEFMKCSLAILFGTLSRYEVWPVAILMAMFFVTREVMKGRRYRCPYAFFLFGGIIAWLFYNLAIFRDPLIWISGPFIGGVGGYYTGVIERIINPSLPDLVSYGLPSMVMLSGFIGSILPVAIFASLIQKNWNRFRVALLLVAPLILIFEIGYISGIEIVKLYFSLPSILLLCFSLPSYIKGHSRTTILKVLSILCVTTMYLTPILSQYTVAYPNRQSPLGTEIKLIAKTIEHGNPILMSGAGSIDPSKTLSVLCGVSPSKIIDEWDNPLLGKASRTPWKYCGYVIVPKQPISQSTLKSWDEYYGNHFLYLYYHDLEWRSEFLDHFTLILETQNYLVFQIARS